MEINENRRKILTLHDMTDDIESRMNDFVTRELSMLRAHIGELQKVIDSYQDMEDKISSAITSRDK
jgi:prefoldin subunit 5